jgi:hypothetical protein
VAPVAPGVPFEIRTSFSPALQSLFRGMTRTTPLSGFSALTHIFVSTPADAGAAAAAIETAAAPAVRTSPTFLDLILIYLLPPKKSSRRPGN